MKLAFAILILIHLLTLCCCNENSTKAKKELTSVPILTAIGHTRNAEPSDNYIPIKVMEMLKHKNGPIMLLGDLAYYTSQDSSVLEELNKHIDLTRNDVLLAPGNHDISNRSILKAYFQKEYPQVYRDDSLLLITLDSEIDSGSIVGDQFLNLEKTLREHDDVASIIIGTHQLIWLQDNNVYQAIADSLINGYVGDCSYCLHENNFYEEVLPMIEKACPNSDIYFLAGDLGHKVTHYVSNYSDKITFIAVGNNGEKEFTTLQFFLGNTKHLEFNISSVKLNNTNI